LIRWQLPAYSPLALGRILSAALDAAIGAEGPLERLAEHLQSEFRAERAILTGSGTHALQLALSGARARAPGRPVALPAYTCFDVATAALAGDVPAVFYDVEPTTLAPDLGTVRSCLDAGASTVVANSLYGFPLDWGALQELCVQRGALLIEDAAQGNGSAWQGQGWGRFGDLTVLSFGRGKGWTGGVGGALLVRREEDLPPAAIPLPDAASTGMGAKAFALSLAQWGLGRPLLFGVPQTLPGLGLGETTLHLPTPASGMPAFAASCVLRHEALALGRGPDRRSQARRWDEALQGVSGVSPCRPLAEEDCGYLRYPVRASASVARALDSPAARRGGVARGYPRALPDLPELEALGGGPDVHAPGARELARALRTLPVHSIVKEVDRRRVLAMLARPVTR